MADKPVGFNVRERETFIDMASGSTVTELQVSVGAASESVSAMT